MGGHAELRVRVMPRAGRNAVETDGGGRIVVRVTAPAEGGRANAAVIALLAKRLGVPKRSVQIVSGVRSRDKRIRIAGMSDAALRAAMPQA